jgi:cobalamin synthase
MIGGVFLLLGKFVGLQAVIRPIESQAVDSGSLYYGPRMVFAAIVVARCLVLSVAAGASYPRIEGTGKIIVEETRWPEAGAFAFLAAGLCWITSPDWVAALALFALSFATVLVLRWNCQFRLGGITGDCMGAAIELSELVFLMTAAILRK